MCNYYNTLSRFFSICACEHMSIWVQIHECVHGGQQLTLGVILHVLAALYLETVSYWPGSSQ